MIRTERLELSRLTTSDAPFILELLNDKDFLEQIGDRCVRSLADAERYIFEGPEAMFERFGHGLMKVSLAEGTPIGLCGILRREGLEEADLGFAFLPEFRGRGYAFEAAKAVLEHARSALGLKRIVAICSLGNLASISLLERLGFAREGTVRLPGSEEDLWLYACSV